MEKATNATPSSEEKIIIHGTQARYSKLKEWLVNNQAKEAESSLLSV
jgi:hypothetical protein